MTLNNEEIIALTNIINYLDEAEIKHYEECIASGEEASCHIWHSIKTLTLKLKHESMKETP
tara:strand:- start:760 stop:942 length:183 start_codon:yes stop_codon:yes gene_type:complete